MPAISRKTPAAGGPMGAGLRITCVSMVEDGNPLTDGLQFFTKDSAQSSFIHRAR